MRSGAVGEQHLMLQLAVRRRLQHALVDQREVPLRQVLRGGELEQPGARAEDLLADPGTLLLGRPLEALTEPAVAGVDLELGAVLHVFEGDDADVGDLVLPGVPHARRDHLVTERETPQRQPPLRGRKKVADYHDQRAAADQPACFQQRAAQVRRLARIERHHAPVHLRDQPE